MITHWATTTVIYIILTIMFPYYKSSIWTEHEDQKEEDSTQPPVHPEINTVCPTGNRPLESEIEKRNHFQNGRCHSFGRLS